ncbi:hypothetical protein [Pedobacter gandavensis]|uniref:hypothetical protein n=1 Tax=Pedobacter gandavensis TaxID=2679963 RepID=UPI00292E6E44|nr:hypothetical protein [Pedobacter gandavensis]
MNRLNIMTILTANSYFWLFSCLLLTILLMMILISYLLKYKTTFSSDMGIYFWAGQHSKKG